METLTGVSDGKAMGVCAHRHAFRPNLDLQRSGRAISSHISRPKFRLLCFELEVVKPRPPDPPAPDPPSSP